MRETNTRADVCEMASDRILIITRNLPPLVGGMERLNWHMADELSKYANVRAVGPRGSAHTQPLHVDISEAPLNPLPLFLFVAFCKALWITLRWKPDVILAGSGLTAPLAWILGKICKARTAVYLHGFDITVKDRVYQSLWVPVFKKMNRVIVNSTPTKELALAAGVPDVRISIVFPGVSLPEKAQPDEVIAAFKREHGLENKKIMLSVGRLTTRKGLKEFVELSLPAIVKQVPEAMLVVVGEAPKQSLGAGIQSRESIEQAADILGIKQHILFLGVITDPVQLATVYEAADVHVFPVRHIPDDPEGFGMVAIEAAAHGLPTAAFATGGIVDAVKHGKSGYLADKNNYSQLAEHTLQLLHQLICQKGIKEFVKGFAWQKFGQGVWLALS